MSETPDPDDLARRYLDLWQQHLTQAANDPALAAGLAKLSAAFAVPGGAGMPGWPFPPQTGSTHEEPPRRTETAVGPSERSQRDFDQLAERLDALEKRLDALERQPARRGKRAPKGSGSRKP